MKVFEMFSGMFLFCVFLFFVFQMCIAHVFHRRGWLQIAMDHLQESEE